MRGGLDVVDDVVELARELVHVGTVQRGDERRIDLVEEPVGELVVVVLDVHQPVGDRLVVRLLTAPLSEDGDAPSDVVGGLIKERVECPVLGL